MTRLSTRFAEWLRLPGAPTSGSEASSPERFRAHVETLDRRPAFNELVTDIQTDILALIEAHADLCAARVILEIGSGVIPLNELSSDALSSDIEAGRGVDLLLSATAVPLRNDSLRAVVGQNVFHHIFDYRQALHEMTRVLQQDGVIVLIEPHHGWLARRIYPALFSFEGYDVDARLEETLHNAAGEQIPNQASSYIVFEREATRFKNEFPRLQIIQTIPLPSGVRYLATGGLNFRQMLPSFVLRWIRRSERTKIGNRILAKLALHWVVVLQVVN